MYTPWIMKGVLTNVWGRISLFFAYMPLLQLVTECEGQGQNGQRLAAMHRVRSILMDCLCLVSDMSGANSAVGLKNSEASIRLTHQV